MTIEENILAILAQEAGLKGREIAQRLGVENSAANAALFQLKTRRLAQQDAAYRWWLIQPGEAAPANQRATADTTLARLCRYYLHCLSLDDEAGVSVFARSQHAPDYVELPALPDFDPEQRAVSSHPGVSALFHRLRRGTSRQAPFLGYPVRLRFHRSARGWEGFFVEPLLLFEFADDGSHSESGPMLTGEMPTFNFRVVRVFAAGNDQHVMEEAAALAEELGLDGAELPELDELMTRFVEIRSGWDWKEAINPAELSGGTPLADINEAGIYNRAVVFGCERSPYTKGLEQELAKLQTFSEANYGPTALGAWLNRKVTSRRAASTSDAELLEPLPLNSEQREAVEKSLSQPLTVITGPPGTGKSQVVSSLLINAAKRGLRVLFASKNNKAVDVVESRVNALGPRPILLRLGRGLYQANLAQYLTNLLASRANEEDAHNHREAAADYSRLTEQIRATQQRASKVIELRNAVDAAERAVETLRTELGEDWFQHFRSLRADKLSASAANLRAAAELADRSRQPFLTKLLWFLHRKTRIQSLRAAALNSLPVMRNAALETPALPQSDADVSHWLDAARHLGTRAEQARAIAHYSALLAALSAGDRIEELSRLLARLSHECAEKSLGVWESWLRLAPTRLTPEDRHTLGEFSATLRLIAQADEGGAAIGREVFARYYRLFPKLGNQLPCWAVTSLSARGRVPLEPGFFDLLIVDEASQCDIASILPLLYRAKAAVVIGDPMQLKHISAISPRRDRQLLEQHGLTDTHMSWAFSENSVFDLASPLAASEDIVMLRDHHRSHADVIGFSNEHFYEGRLRVATNYDRLESPSRGEPAVRWIHVQGNVVRRGSGAMNEAEAHAVIRELERMVIRQGYRGSIGVVTPFRAQANRIRDLIHAHPQANGLLSQGELLVDTVHRFQGDERDVMIFSPVVSTGMPDGATSFLRKTGNLFNVAITRARASLVVVGDRGAAKASGIEHLSAFAEYVAARANTKEADADSHSPDYDAGPVYPTAARPDLVSDWERTFYGHLYAAGLRPIPQFDVEKYTLDFALLSGSRRLDIEVDGERYHRDWNGELLRRDQLRNMRLIELGWDVMRFWVYELRDNMAACVERVRLWAKS